MKVIYPVIITNGEPGEKYLNVYIPDLEINTEGDGLTDAIVMARDAIGVYFLACDDLHKEAPKASSIQDIHADEDDAIITLVDVDIDDYRRKNDVRSVKKNCTIPSWLNWEAEKAGVNFSAVLQSGLKRELHLTD